MITKPSLAEAYSSNNKVSPVFLVIPSKLTTEDTGAFMKELALYGTPMLCSGDMNATRSMVKSMRYAAPSGGLLMMPRPLICIALLAPNGTSRLKEMVTTSTRTGFETWIDAGIKVGRGIYETLLDFADTSTLHCAIAKAKRVNGAAYTSYGELSRVRKDYRIKDENWTDSYGTIPVLRTLGVDPVGALFDLSKLTANNINPAPITPSAPTTNSVCVVGKPTLKHKLHLAASWFIKKATNKKHA